MNRRKFERAFALPTVIITSVILMMVLVGALSTVSSTKRSLDQQYYNQLAREAAESGLAMAKYCLQQSDGTNFWTAPLRPNTDCSGGDACTSGPSCYVLSDSSMNTTFTVSLPTLQANSTYGVTVSSATNLLRTSTQTTWKTYDYTQATSVSLAVTPEISGGAGWSTDGHVGVLKTTSNQLYGFGDNSNKQISDSATPAIASYPQKLTLPFGVASVKKIITSGQGASYMCIIGSDDQAYCRGQGMSLPAGWNKVSGWPATNKVYDASLNGYGADSACFIVGDSLSTSQAYCIGMDDWGMTGNGITCANWGVGACSHYSASNAQLFLLPAGSYAAKVSTMDQQTCVITTVSDLYCAGLDNGGQLTGSTGNTVVVNGTRIVVTPIKYNLPSSRKVNDVLIGGYHGPSGGVMVHVLATDGTVWSSGWYGNGEAGNNTTAGSTGTSQTPVLFGGFDQPYGTGDIIKLTTQNKCIGNYNNANANNNPVVIFTCLGRSNQGQVWVYSQENHQIENVATGKCLNIPYRNFVNFQLLSIYDCNNDLSQKFTFNSNGSISVDGAPGLCVDVPSGNTTDGTQMQIYSCIGSWPQAFAPGGSINGWRGIVTGNTFFCAFRDDVWSGMWCAGKNNYGQFANVGTLLGGGAHGSVCEDTAGAIRNMNAASGEKIDWSRLTSEWQYQYDSMVFITKSGNVYGAGRNLYGKLGNGITGDAGNDYRTCNTRQLILPSGVTARGLSTRDEYSTYILGSDGSLYATGRNNNGQLGNGITTDTLTPVKSILPRSETRAF